MYLWTIIQYIEWEEVTEQYYLFIHCLIENKLKFLLKLLW